jgi:hypothetical protein
LAATIDNLSSFHRYTVIRGFTDAKGVTVPFETVGAIRHISLNPQMTEIYIDWERIAPDGKRTPERLTFLMSATDGPRNNHMRTYFETGEVDLPPREPKPPKAEQPPESKEPKRPAQLLDRYNRRQPQEELLLHELTVACDCGPAFHRAVWPGGHLGVNACLRCGAVTVTKQVGDDGRFTGDSWTAYWTVPTSPKVVDWLGRFPRVAIDHAGAPWRWAMSASLVRYPMLWYPSDTRVADEEELKSLEGTLSAAQVPLTRADRIWSACGDISAPPEGADESFARSVMVQRALDFRPASDLDTLRHYAQLLASSSELAASVLLRRPGAYETMMEWLGSEDDDTFSAGIAMLRDARPLFSGPDDPKLAPELLKLLNALPLGKLKDVPNRVESCFRFEAYLVAIADLGANSIEMQDGLRALRVKLARKDDTLLEAMQLVLNELNGINNRPMEYR